MSGKEEITWNGAWTKIKNRLIKGLYHELSKRGITEQPNHELIQVGTFLL